MTPAGDPTAPAPTAADAPWLRTRARAYAQALGAAPDIAQALADALPPATQPATLTAWVRAAYLHGAPTTGTGAGIAAARPATVDAGAVAGPATRAPSGMAHGGGADIPTSADGRGEGWEGAATTGAAHPSGPAGVLGPADEAGFADPSDPAHPAHPAQPANASAPADPAGWVRALAAAQGVDTDPARPALAQLAPIARTPLAARPFLRTPLRRALSRALWRPLAALLRPVQLLTGRVAP